MSRVVAALLAGWVAAACAAPAIFRQEDPDRLGAMRREIATRPIGLDAGAGVLHQKVTTASPEAQAYYDQGLAYLAGYVWIDAARSFHEALRRDSALAMAHLGLARAYAGAESEAGARRHLGLARKLAVAGGSSRKEKLWISLGEEQLEAVFAPERQRAELHAAYQRSIEELIALDPDDAHAWVLRGNAEEAGAWGRGQRGGVGSVAFYESALRRDPDHLGAHHFLVHAFERLRRYEDAARHGARFALLAPRVPHAQHMYGHVLPRIGQWEEAAARFESADALHREYFEREGIAPTEDWHYPHNLHVLGTVYLRLGRRDEARALYRKLFDTPYAGYRGPGRVGPWLGLLILEGRHEEALRDARALEARGHPMARLVGLAYECEALVRLDRIEEADEVRGEAERAGERAVAGAPDPLIADFVSAQRAHLLAPLEGLLALHGDDPEAGRTSLLTVADAIAASPSIDGWATGMFHLVRLADAAEQASLPELAADLRTRIAQIDPTWDAAAVSLRAD